MKSGAHSISDGVVVRDGELFMKWSGYAAIKLKIVLKDFQVCGLKALHMKRDVVIMEATGSGKSTVFQIPVMMFEAGQFALVIIPTVALAQDHLRNLREMNIRATFLTSTSSKVDRSKVVDPSIPKDQRPSVVILTPETLFGSDIQDGVIQQLDHKNIQLVVIDEAHTMFEWESFRSAFKHLKNIRPSFSCPILALSATLKPTNLAAIQRILNHPVVIKGGVNRKNIIFRIAPYRLAKKGNAWSSVALQIIDLAKDQLTIVYCAYAKACNEISLHLSQLGIQSSCYTGAQTTANDKQEIYRSMQSGQIKILVATKAFGLGINLPDVRNVIHIGIPDSLSLWVQEAGRAGRNGQQAYAHLLINENEDSKKLSYWVKKSTDSTHIPSMVEDFLTSWNYISKAFTGDCLRSFQMRYFEDSGNPETMTDGLCCSGCDIRANYPAKNIEKEIRAVLGCIRALNENGIRKVYKGTIVKWISGIYDIDYISSHFNNEELEREPTYGFLSNLMRIQSKLTVKGILRQAFSLKYVSLEVQCLSDSQVMAKFWLLTDLGVDVIDESVKPPDLPDPAGITSVLIS